MRYKKHIEIPYIEQFFRIEEDGGIFSLRKNRYLSPTFNTAGYLYVNITLSVLEENDKVLFSPGMYAVHRLVATKYIGQCPPELETSHKDGDKLNNHYTNMEYLTHSENILKSFRDHGRVMRPYRHLPASYETKLKMSNAKKKRVKLLFDNIEIVFNSIEEASMSTHINRRQVYTCIKKNIPINTRKSTYNGGILSFIDT